ncbi:hypothetical protein MJL79_32545, partial [Salmonella enterica subsp. enterica serovar Montevideo]|nr:hypothetical protein [Salmonella enterica subsp. enterica serovar Montevideo]
LFMVWCVLADAPEMSSDELLCTRTNWNRVILEGRKPGLTLGIDMSQLATVDISKYQNTTAEVQSHAHGLMGTILSLVPTNII